MMKREVSTEAIRYLDAVANLGPGDAQKIHYSLYIDETPSRAVNENNKQPADQRVEIVMHRGEHCYSWMPSLARHDLALLWISR